MARRRWLAAVALLLLTVVVYVPALRAGFIWDDDSYVTQNANLRSLPGLGRIWLEPGSHPQYYPLVHTTFWIEYRLWRLRPFGFHLTNVLLHAVGAILAWRVLRRLSVPGAWLAAVLFAVHPVHVESVAWVTERKNVLSMVLYLAALLSYFNFRAPESPSRSGSGGWYVLSLLLFAGALMSKTVTASLPAAILVILWWKRGRIGRRDVLPLLPMLAAGIAAGLFTAYLERMQVGATGAAWDLSPVERLLIAGRAVWFYAGKLVWPQPLVFIYPRWLIDAGAWWQYVFPVSAAAVVVVAWALRRRLGRGPLAALLLFGGTLVPALGFVNVYPMKFSFVADHFQYMASLALIALLVSAAASAFAAPRRRFAGRVVATVIVLVCAALTWGQSLTYRDLETLWTTTIDRNPNAWIAHNNLGALRFAEGDLSAAATHFEEAVRIEPENPESHNNLAAALMGQGHRFRAERLLEQVLRIDPDHHEAYYNLGRIHRARGDLTQAAAQFEQAIRIWPGFAEAHNGLGEVYLEDRQVRRAISRFDEALRIQPDHARARENLARAQTLVDR